MDRDFKRASIDLWPEFRNLPKFCLRSLPAGECLPQTLHFCAENFYFPPAGTFFRRSVKISRKSYNTPKRTEIVKTRLTREEKAYFDERCRVLQISQSDFIRQAIFKGRVQPVILVEGRGEEALAEISGLMTECRRIGNNLNQIARYYNSGEEETAEIRTELRNALTELTGFRLNAEKVICEHYGDHKAYQL